MGGGFPIGAFWLSDRPVDASGKTLSSLMGPGSHGTTYGGNPLACAASLAVLAEVTEQNLEANVLRQEQRIRATIASWQLPAITEVRGLGLLLGIGLDVTKFAVPQGKLPAAYLCSKLLEAGLLVPPAGPETIRLLPPLNVSDAEVDEALAIFHATLSSLITDH
jgi:acetylornithine/succinyldiaminopimelate/putrescine aminotransferase